MDSGSCHSTVWGQPRQTPVCPPPSPLQVSLAAAPHAAVLGEGAQHRASAGHKVALVPDRLWPCRHTPAP